MTTKVVKPKRSSNEGVGNRGIRIPCRRRIRLVAVNIDQALSENTVA